MARILVVEDSADLAYGVKRSLELEGHQVEVSADGASGLQRALKMEPDLGILNLMLPELDGYGVLRALRDSGMDVPVILLTARDEEADKVIGFRLGADQYVTKPFGVLELLARVEQLLRKARREADPGTEWSVSAPSRWTPRRVPSPGRVSRWTWLGSGPRLQPAVTARQRRPTVGVEPGSTVCLAWQQRREDRVAGITDFQLDRDADALFRTRPKNVLMIKADYWLNF